MGGAGLGDGLGGHPAIAALEAAVAASGGVPNADTSAALTAVSAAAARGEIPNGLAQMLAQVNSEMGRGVDASVNRVPGADTPPAPPTIDPHYPAWNAGLDAEGYRRPDQGQRDQLIGAGVRPSIMHGGRPPRGPRAMPPPDFAGAPEALASLFGNAYGGNASLATRQQRAEAEIDWMFRAPAGLSLPVSLQEARTVAGSG